MSSSSKTIDGGESSLLDRLSLKGKNFLITGGARGIGFATATEIAKLGGGVAIIDCLPKPVDEYNTLAERFGIKTSYVQGDVTDQKSMEEAFTKSVEAIGQLHGGLMAAGICREEPIVDADWEFSMKTLGVNIMGTFWMAKLLARHLIDRETPGSLVFIASLVAQGIKMPCSSTTIYNASKAAVKGMVGPLAVELGPHQIRVNSISPGAIDTSMTQSFDSSIYDFYTTATPMSRLGAPEDIAHLVCYLLSDASSFSTGGDFLATGGIHAGTSKAWNYRT